MGRLTSWLLPGLLTGMILAIHGQGKDSALPRNYCKGMPYGSFKRHPYDCSKYISCRLVGNQGSSANSVTTLRCQHGLLYDERIQACNYAHAVQCRTSARPTFTQAIRPTRPTRRRQQKFLRDTSNMMHDVHSPDMSRFVKVINAPEAPAASNVALQDNFKEQKFQCGERDGLYLDPANCKRYYICSFKQPYAFNCPHNTYFHKDLQRCEYRSDFGSDPCARQHLRPTGQLPTDRPRGEDMMAKVAGFMDEAKKMASDMVDRAARTEARAASPGRTTGGQKPFHSIAKFLGSDTTIKKMAMGAERQLETLKIIKDKFDLSKDEIQKVMDQMHPTLQQNPSTMGPDMPKTDVKIDMCPFPNQQAPSSCDRRAKYRTLDGSCNNLKNPLWGMAKTPFTRFLHPDYNDGVSAPRRGVNNSTLPSSRYITQSVFKDSDATSHVHSLMLMSVGQLLDHDLTRTALSTISSANGELSDVTCGSDGCSTKGEENRACFPIEIPANDPVFGSQPCLMFVRTAATASLDCKLGPRQQVNQITGYMDASMVYGSSLKELGLLRSTDNKRGMLRMTKNPHKNYKDLLPQAENEDCRDTTPTIKCFFAGDERVNENIILTGLQLVFARFHNIIENDLHRRFGRWSGEKLFQETRKIVGAVWQHIVYNEYLPIVLGPQALSRYGLASIPTYDPAVSASIANVFAAAAFRFGHSLIPGLFNTTNHNYETLVSKDLSEIIRRPSELYNNAHGGSGVDAVLQGAMAQKATTIDAFFTNQVMDHLFTDNPPKGIGTDLPAINIQRGRDQGIPSYLAWRELCGLPVATSFNDLHDISEKDRIGLQKAYTDIKDIDLFAGAICEKHVAAGVVGPTFSCILGIQFRNTKIGDRFWYENRNKPHSFNNGQIREIQKMTLSKVLCMCMDQKQNGARIQKYAMLMPISEAFKSLGRQDYRSIYSLASLYHGQNNERKPCLDFPNMDLSKWKSINGNRPRPPPGSNGPRPPPGPNGPRPRPRPPPGQNGPRPRPPPPGK